MRQKHLLTEARKDYNNLLCFARRNGYPKGKVKHLLELFKLLDKL